MPPPTPPPLRPPLIVWWLLWAAALLELPALWFGLGFSGRPLAAPHANPFVDLAGLAPLFVAIILRWLVLPRLRDSRRVFLLFFVGLLLAGACGVLGLFRGGPYRDELFLLGVLGVAQFLPVFVRPLLAPRPQGFIPNR